MHFPIPFNSGQSLARPPAAGIIKLGDIIITDSTHDASRAPVLAESARAVNSHWAPISHRDMTVSSYFHFRQFDARFVNKNIFDVRSTLTGCYLKAMTEFNYLHLF